MRLLGEYERDKSREYSCAYCGDTEKTKIFNTQAPTSKKKKRKKPY
jgi:hypothetical protein